MELWVHGIAAILAATAAVVLAASACKVYAQSFPSKPIRAIIPAAPGSNNDIFFRTLAPSMGTILGQQLIADYRPGGGGHLAVGCQMAEEGGDFGFAEGCGVALAAPEDKALDPVHVGLLRAAAVVQATDRVMHLVEQSWGP